MLSAKRPRSYSLTADSDFSFQLSIKREQIDSLYTLGFIERYQNVTLAEAAGCREELPGNWSRCQRLKTLGVDLVLTQDWVTGLGDLDRPRFVGELVIGVLPG